jgi:hypothetical protein
MAVGWGDRLADVLDEAPAAPLAWPAATLSFYTVVDCH